MMPALTSTSTAMTSSSTEFSSQGKFVSRKVNVVRWQPVLHPWDSSKGQIFVSGSWDDDRNVLQVWECARSQTEGQGQTNGDPKALATVPHAGDVNGIEVYNKTDKFSVVRILQRVFHLPEVFDRESPRDRVGPGLRDLVPPGGRSIWSA